MSTDDQVSGQKSSILQKFSKKSNFKIMHHKVKKNTFIQAIDKDHDIFPPKIYPGSLDTSMGESSCREKSQAGDLKPHKNTNSPFSVIAEKKNNLKSSTPFHLSSIILQNTQIEMNTERRLIFHQKSRSDMMDTPIKPLRTRLESTSTQ